MRPLNLLSLRWLGLLLLLGCTVTGEPVPASIRPRLTPVPQRVTARIERKAVQLVRLETEHGTLLTTPEHPFATPRSGWVSAGQLVSGDWVVSGRFGAVRLLSARRQPAPQPIPVFNLSVASSRAYFVGPDRVLVHNARCNANSSESREAAIERMSHEREALLREIEELKKTAPASPRIAELKAEREKLRHKLDHRRRAQRKEQGVTALNSEERARKLSESDYETAQKALEEAELALAELEGRTPSSEAERAQLAARKEALQRQITALKLSADRAKQILNLLEELAQLEKNKPATPAARQALEQRKQELRARLKRERTRMAQVKFVRKKRATTEGREASAQYDRAVKGRAKLQLERLERELASQRQEAPSENRDARIAHLADQIDTLKRIIEGRKQSRKVRERRLRLQREREDRIANGADTGDIDHQLREVEREHLALRIEHMQLRVREQLLAQLDETPWAHAPGSLDEARLLEFERQLAEGLANEQQLDDIERVLDAVDPTHAALQDAVWDEAEEVNAILREREELIRQDPSPERTAELQSSYGRLEQELREGRAAVEVAVSALVNEYAHVQTTQEGSSNGPRWQERLNAILEDQAQVRAQWRANLQARLHSVRQELQVRQTIERFRDEAIEAELAREIFLLERELQR